MQEIKIAMVNISMSIILLSLSSTDLLIRMYGKVQPFPDLVSIETFVLLINFEFLTC